jgi:hypothetical protein
MNGENAADAMPSETVGAESVRPDHGEFRDR